MDNSILNLFMMICIYEFWISSLVMESGNPDRIFVVFLITIE